MRFCVLDRPVVDRAKDRACSFVACLYPSESPNILCSATVLWKGYVLGIGQQGGHIYRFF